MLSDDPFLSFRDRFPEPDRDFRRSLPFVFSRRFWSFYLHPKFRSPVGFSRVRGKRSLHSSMRMSFIAYGAVETRRRREEKRGEERWQEEGGGGE